MNSDDLAFVLHLHSERTLAGAARRLGVSHTTVARRVAALEDELGSQLFAKTPHGQVLTHAGEEVVRVARQVHEQLATLDRKLLGHDARLSGKLRVTTIDAFAFHFAKELGAFSQRYPAVELEVAVDNRARNLTKREADVAIRFSNRPAEHLVGRKIGRVQLAVHGSEELIAAQDDPQDLSAYPWLSWCDTEGAPFTERFLAKHAPKVMPMFRVDSVLTMLASVRAGIGVSLIGCLWADRTEGIRRIRDIEPGFGIDLWVLTHPDIRHTARLRAFTDHLHAAMQPHLSRGG